MSNPSKLLKDVLPLTGKMRAIVVTVEDPDKEGKIGVYIPRIMGTIDDFKTASESLTSLMADLMVIKSRASMEDDSAAISLSSTVTTLNYVWAKRCAYHFRDEKNKFYGDWRVPRVGSEVFVEFIDGDPQQLYYLPFGPCDNDKNKVLPLNIKAGSPNADILHMTYSGSAIGFIEGGKDEFVIQLNEKQEIRMKVEDDSIKLKVKNSSIELKNDTVTVSTKKANITADEATIKANQKCIVKSSGSLSIVTNDSALWAPNCIKVCPITGLPHGGAPTINFLKGTE